MCVWSVAVCVPIVDDLFKQLPTFCVFVSFCVCVSFFSFQIAPEHLLWIKWNFILFRDCRSIHLFWHNNNHSNELKLWGESTIHTQRAVVVWMWCERMFGRRVCTGKRRLDISQIFRPTLSIVIFASPLLIVSRSHLALFLSFTLRRGYGLGSLCNQHKFTNWINYFSLQSSHTTHNTI